jgi:hypothetical protein
MGAQGWVELVFNPRSPLERYISAAIKFINPYLAAFTYKFHAEKAREAGKYFPSTARCSKSPNEQRISASHQYASIELF